MFNFFKNYLARRELKKQEAQKVLCSSGKHEYTKTVSQFKNGCWAIENFFEVCAHCNHHEFLETKINYD